MQASRLARAPKERRVCTAGGPQGQSRVFRWVCTAQPAHTVQGGSAGPQRVYVFDHKNPAQVKELIVSPHEELAAAEELLQSVQRDGLQEPGAQLAGDSKALPLPLMPVGSGNGASGRQPATAAKASSNGNGFLGMALSKDKSNKDAQLALKQEEQLQAARMAQLQYEGLYREWRLKAERLEVDISQLQRLVAEKDAELAHGYKLLEASAAERSRLRHSYQASQEKAKQLQFSLAEAQSRQLKAPAPQPALGAGSNGHGGREHGNGHGAPGSNGVPLNTKVQELSSLAQQLQSMARDMIQEVNDMKNKPAVK